MSVEVGLDRVRQEIERFGAGAFLLTVRDGSRPHVVSVAVEVDGDDLVVGAGRRTAANVAEQGQVALLWAGPDPDGFSLIVDGTATADGSVGDDGARLRIRPLKAVLHRPRSVVEPGAIGSDCRTVLDRPTP
jgi:hypothetical protein